MFICSDVMKNLPSLRALSPFGIFPLFQLSAWSINKEKGLKMQLQFVLPYRLIRLCRQWCWVHAFQTAAVWQSAVTYVFKPSILKLVQSSADNETSIHPTQPLSALQLVEFWIDTNKLVFLQGKWRISLSLERQSQPHRISMLNPSATMLDISSGIISSLVIIDSFRTSSFFFLAAWVYCWSLDLWKMD